jgi:hypothetical protein
MLSIFLNVSKFMKDKENFKFDFVLVLDSFYIVYGISFLFPALLCFILWISKYKMNCKMVVAIFGMYGYSNLFLILGTFLPLFTILFLQILIFVLFVFAATIFLFFNLKRLLSLEAGNGRKIVIYFIAIGQIGVTLLYILLFFV